MPCGGTGSVGEGQACEGRGESRAAKLKRVRKRGPYRRYSENDKRKAINTALKLQSEIKAADILSIPIKNLKRWIKNGPVRRKGGRRTQDPQMERRLIEWIKNYLQTNKSYPLSKDIRDKAILFSDNKKLFKASKGWLEKFMCRHFGENILNTKRESNSIKPPSH